MEYTINYSFISIVFIIMTLIYGYVYVQIIKDLIKHPKETTKNIAINTWLWWFFSGFVFTVYFIIEVKDILTISSSIIHTIGCLIVVVLVLHYSKKNNVYLLKQNKDSSYCPVEYDELARLRKQSKLREDFDLSGLEYGLSLMDKKEDLIGLDIGCSEGFVTNERFSKIGGFSHIIGVDQSTDAIKKANSSNYINHSFYNIDIETTDGIQLLKDKLTEIGEDGFDLIFSSAVFHHLNNPTKVFRELRKIMNKNGVVVISSFDDQLTLAYPDDDNIVEKIFKLSEKIPGMSNRKHGRQIYNQLWKAGFKNQKFFLGMLDTAGKDIDERMNVYQNNFQWRPNYIKRAIKKYPDKKVTLEKDLKLMETALENLEEMFESEDFFLMEPVIVAVGQKV